MNKFGGDWTIQKIEIVVNYAKAYLTIMNKYPHFKTLYFDGFAGSGDIFREDEVDMEISKGTALRILEIILPKKFDRYYFVEKARPVDSSCTRSAANLRLHRLQDDTMRNNCRLQKIYTGRTCQNRTMNIFDQVTQLVG